MSKHTPGPWKDDSRIAIVGDPYSKSGQHALYCADITRHTGGLSVCTIQSQDHCDGGITRDEAAANARLIAAAPEMYEALKLFANLDLSVNSDLWAIDKRKCAEARAIIASVEGES